MVRNIGKLRRNPDKFQQMIANIPWEKLTEMESVHEMAQFYTKSHQSSTHYLVLHSSQQHKCLPQAKNFFSASTKCQINLGKIFLKDFFSIFLGDVGPILGGGVYFSSRGRVALRASRGGIPPSPPQWFTVGSYYIHNNQNAFRAPSTTETSS